VSAFAHSVTIQIQPSTHLVTCTSQNKQTTTKLCKLHATVTAKRSFNYTFQSELITNGNSTKQQTCKKYYVFKLLIFCHIFHVFHNVI